MVTKKEKVRWSMLMKKVIRDIGRMIIRMDMVVHEIKRLGEQIYEDGKYAGEWKEDMKHRKGTLT
jgi:hypothetical protein